MHILCKKIIVHVSWECHRKIRLKLVDEENYAIRTPERKTLWQVQTPQCFEFDLVKKAYEKMMENDDGKVTDDAMVIETYGNVPVKLFEGGYDGRRGRTVLREQHHGPHHPAAVRTDCGPCHHPRPCGPN